MSYVGAVHVAICGTGVEGEANVVHSSWPANIKSIYKTLV